MRELATRLEKISELYQDSNRYAQYRRWSAYDLRYEADYLEAVGALGTSGPWTAPEPTAMPAAVEYIDKLRESNRRLIERLEATEQRALGYAGRIDDLRAECDAATARAEAAEAKLAMYEEVPAYRIAAELREQLGARDREIAALRETLTNSVRRIDEESDDADKLREQLAEARARLQGEAIAAGSLAEPLRIARERAEAAESRLAEVEAERDKALRIVQDVMPDFAVMWADVIANADRWVAAWRANLANIGENK